jgi:uncharacterized membrane protein YfcA
MPVDWTTFQVLAVLFVATFIRSAFGFGEALISVPLLALIMPVETAAPVAVLVSITVSGIAMVQDWRHVHFRSAVWLTLATLAGTPLGLLMLTRVAEPIVKAVLGAIIIAFSSYCLISRSKAALRDDRFAGVFGFLAGILGGAYGMNGPPLVIYGTLRGWSPQHFRATLQGYFLPASLMAMGGYWLTGLWTGAVTRLFVTALPVVLISIVLGRAVNQRMTGRAFLLYIHAGLILLGFTLLYQSLLQH